jgi:hypothetical protein
VTIRLTPAQALALGLDDPSAKPARARRKPGELEVLPDGHVVHLPFVDVLEHELDAQLMELAKRYGWYSGPKDEGTLDGLAYHAATPMTQQERGWPDRVLVRRRDRRLIFAELKKERGVATARQAAVLDLLRCLAFNAGVGTDGLFMVGPGTHEQLGPRIEVFLWRPCQLEEIEAVLR